MLAGRQVIPLAFNGASRFHTIGAANIAELIRLAAASPGERTLNAVDPEALPVRELVGLVADAAGHQVEVLGFDGAPPADGPAAGAGTSPWSVPNPIVGSMDAAADQLGYAAVGGYADLVPSTVHWLRAQLDERSWDGAFPLMPAMYGPGFADFAAEDELISALIMDK